MLVEITARSFSQLITMITVYIVNAIFNAVLFGILFDLLGVTKQQESEFSDRMDIANNSMINLNLSTGLRDRVR